MLPLYQVQVGKGSTDNLDTSEKCVMTSQDLNNTVDSGAYDGLMLRALQAEVWIIWL